MPDPNNLLRNARESTPSRRVPGTHMSREELAEAVALWISERDDEGRDVAFDANHLGKLERGTVRRPRPMYLAALCGVLGADAAELGFVTPQMGTNDDVNRKTFLRAALGMGAGAVVAQRFPDHDASDLAAAVAGPTAHYRRMESAVATPELVPAVEAHLRLATSVVSASLPTTVGFGVLSETAGLAAWLSADRGDTGTARQHYADALRHAQRARHPLLTAYMLASLGHFAVESGDSRHGVTLLDRARRTIDGNQVSDAARAWLASLQAVAHAATGNRNAALAELRTAEKLTNSHRGDPHWPWVFAFDAAKAARYQASTLARLGDISAARTAFTAAIPSLTSPKPRAVAQADQAHALAQAGHVEEASTLALDALATGRQYGSERVTQRVRAVRRLLPSNTRATAELDQHLTALYREGR